MCFSYFISNVFDTNSTTYAAVTILANLGTIIALGFTVHSVNTSRKQNKLFSAKTSLDGIFKNIEDSLNGLTFFKQGTEYDTQFGRQVIYRLQAFGGHEYAAFCRNKSNYKLSLAYVNYLFSTLELIKFFKNELDNEHLKKFYADKLQLEMDFLQDAFLVVMDGCRKYETGENDKQILDEIADKVRDIREWLR